MMQVLSVLRCDYTPDGAAGTMHRIPSQPCGEGVHVRLVVVSLFAVALIYPMMLFFERRRQSAAPHGQTGASTPPPCLGWPPPRLAAPPRRQARILLSAR